MFSLDISESRLEKFKRVSSKRQTDLTVVLENVHDLHNIGAVLRSCDSVGIDEIYVIDTDSRLVGRKLIDNQSSSTGINKWITIHEYNDISKCITDLKKKYDLIIGTILDNTAKSIYSYNYLGKTAIVFGNEKDGITPDLQNHIEHYMVIPQVGFAQSLNISVACAVTLYEVYRQRDEKGFYKPKDADSILNRYRHIDENKRLNKINKKPFT
ncbi:MAG: RNA methyltransferase [Saprospiraceae bacterium]